MVKFLCFVCKDNPDRIGISGGGGLPRIGVISKTEPNLTCSCIADSGLKSKLSIRSTDLESRPPTNQQEDDSLNLWSEASVVTAAHWST